MLVNGDGIFYFALFSTLLLLICSLDGSNRMRVRTQPHTLHTAIIAIAVCAQCILLFVQQQPNSVFCMAFDGLREG